jgi:mutator protein MutT
LNSKARPKVHVVAAAIRDTRSRLLIAQRPAGKHMAGGWEFPGGKIESGETRLEGLRRELAEEIGIKLLAAHPLIRIRHAYADRDVDLDVWAVTAFEGLPSGIEGQQLRWCPPEDLASADLIAADRPIVTTLVLPECIAVEEDPRYMVGAGPAKPGQFRGRFCADSAAAAAAIVEGADFLLVSRILDPPSIEALTAELNVPVYVRDVSPEVAWACGASGLHTLS